jgi:hypothetical protein
LEAEKRDKINRGEIAAAPVASHTTVEQATRTWLADRTRGDGKASLMGRVLVEWLKGSPENFRKRKRRYSIIRIHPALLKEIEGALA